MRFLAVAMLLCFFALHTHATYISEIDQGGPWGSGIELAELDPIDGATLLFIDANPYLPQAFGRVLDVLHVPGSVGVRGLVMLTESASQPWPGVFATLEDVPPASGDDAFNFYQTRLIVVMSGQAEVRRLDDPMNLAAHASRYDSAAVTDWLVLGSGDVEGLYASRGHDIHQINQTFGISLPDRLVDKDDGRVIARAKLPGQPLDRDVFFAGDPGPTNRFEATADLDYIYTPGLGNLPLVVTAPEPGTLGLLAIGLAGLIRRSGR